MDEDKNPVRILLSTITLFGGAILWIVFPSIIILVLTVGTSWLLFPKALIVKRGGMIN